MIWLIPLTFWINDTRTYGASAKPRPDAACGGYVVNHKKEQTNPRVTSKNRESVKNPKRHQ